MVEVCYAWNDGLDGHSAERMTSENNTSYPPSRLGCFCGTALRASVVLRKSSNLKRTVALRVFRPHTQMDMVNVYVHKEVLSPWNPAAAQLQDVFGLEL
jgi:hypothetical protein